MTLIQTCYSYKPLFKGETLKFGTHPNIAIATGWTPVNAVIKGLNPAHYTVIGNLYNPAQGINYLIRNLLYNPQIHYLVALNATHQDKNSGSIACLADFFHNGVEESTDSLGRKVWKILSPYEGYIDGEITYEALQDIRMFVALQVVDHKNLLWDLVEHISFDTFDPWGEPKEFPYSKPDVSSIPSDRIGFRFSGSIPEVWVKILHSITNYGKEFPTRFGTSMIELIDVMAVIDNDNNPDTFPSYLPVSAESIENYLPEMVIPSPSGAKYNYGSRLRNNFKYDQIEQIVQELSKKPSSRGAVASLWDCEDYYTGEPPCFTNLWCRIVNDSLTMTAIFRSHDIYNAWIQNSYGLRHLQEHILSRIGKSYLKLGTLTILSQSAHIYTDILDFAKGVVASQYKQITQKDIVRYDDAVGNYIISVDKGYIEVNRTSSSGLHLKTYTGTYALKLGREIVTDAPQIDPSHALYLGTELQKAEDAIAKGENYVMQ
jgi:thymidylate synthase